MRWEEIKERLRERIPEGSFSIWIEPITCVREEDGLLELGGHDAFFCSWVREQYLPKIEAVLAEAGRGQVRVRLRPVQGGEERAADPEPQLPLPEVTRRSRTLRALHPRYTFDEFMVGQCNYLARQASEAIANGDVAFGNCLYIGAGTGLGKSHLSHAVAHHIIDTQPHTRLHYLTAQQMTSELVRSLRNNTMEAFKRRFYDECDVLLLDDVHVLAGKNKTQEELAAVLDVLMESGKRVILTGAVPPKDIPNLDQRVRSRLSSALITRINRPDPPTRERIIRHKAARQGLDLPDALVGYLADHLHGDVRQIESAVIGIKAKAALTGATPDLSLVQEVLASIVTEEEHLLTVETIRDFLARQFKVSVQELTSRSRKRKVSFPRQVSMYLARKLTDQPLAEIGRAFNRDHSTVVHAIRVITEAVSRDAAVRGQVEHLEKRLREGRY